MSVGVLRGEDECSFAICRRFQHQASVGLGCRHLGAGNDRAGRISHGAPDRGISLRKCSGQILQAQQTGKIRGMVLHENSPRPSQTVSLGGFLLRATLSRSWPAKQLLASDGGMMILESGPNEFLVSAAGFQ